MRHTDLFIWTFTPHRKGVKKKSNKRMSDKRNNRWLERFFYVMKVFFHSFILSYLLNIWVWATTWKFILSSHHVFICATNHAMIMNFLENVSWLHCLYVCSLCILSSHQFLEKNSSGLCFPFRCFFSLSCSRSFPLLVKPSIVAPPMTAIIVVNLSHIASKATQFWQYFGGFDTITTKSQ